MSYYISRLFDFVIVSSCCQLTSIHFNFLAGECRETCSGPTAHARRVVALFTEQWTGEPSELEISSSFGGTNVRGL